MPQFFAFTDPEERWRLIEPPLLQAVFNEWNLFVNVGNLKTRSQNNFNADSNSYRIVVAL